jgi:pimeloyl-ACP methyl ester carboxylesterase
MLLGRWDRLIPAAVGSAVQALRHGAAIVNLEDAAHIPFWTHSDATLSELEGFLDRIVAAGG